MNLSQKQRNYAKMRYKNSKNREKRKLESRQYYAKHREKILTKMKRKKSKKQKRLLAQHSKQWRIRHPIKAKRNIHKHLRTARGRFSRSKYLAKKRNVHFSLGFSSFNLLITCACWYCGTMPTSNLTGFWLDRVNNDPKIGYRRGNVVPCCKRCNVMKNNMSLREFKEHLLQIVRNLELQ